MTTKNIRFMKHYVTDGQSKIRCWYHMGKVYGYPEGVITIYAKDYGNQLYRIFPRETTNDTDSMTDYFEKDRVRLAPDHPLYPAALAAAQRNK